MNLEVNKGTFMRLLTGIFLILLSLKSFAADYVVPANGGTGSFTISMGAVTYPYNKWQLYQSFGSSSGPWTYLGVKEVGNVSITVNQAGLYYYKANQYNPSFSATGMPVPKEMIDTVSVFRGPATVSSPVPSAPQNLSSTDGWISYDGSYALTWTVPASGSASVTYYEWQSNSGTWSNVGLALNSAQITQPNGSYSYNVRACNNTGCSVLAPFSITVDRNIAPTISPSTTSTSSGNFSIGWSGGRANGTAYNQIWLYENGVATWVSGANSHGGVQTTPNPKVFTKTAQGTYNYYVQACHSSTFTGSTTGGAPQFPQAGTGVCATSTTVSVTYDLPAPAAVGSLTLGDSEGTYDTNGTISLTWTAVTHASKYNLRYGKTGTTKLIRTPGGATDTVSGLAEGVWEFDVQACNSVDECGGWSPLASKEVRFVPGQPTNVTSSDGLTSFDGQYSVTWTPPSIGQVDYYQWSDNGGSSWNSVGTALSTTAFTRPNGAVTYYIRACSNATGCGAHATRIITVNIDVVPTITASATTTATGSYTIGWGTGQKNGTALSQMWIYEDGVPTWVAGTNSHGSVHTTPNPKAFTKTTQGTYNYYVQACHSTTFTGSTTGGAPQFPQPGTGVCATSTTVSVTYDLPTPAAVGALTLGDSEGTYDTNGTIALTWTAVAHAAKYNLRYGKTGTTKLIRTPGGATDTLSSLGEGVWEFEVQGCNAFDECGGWSPLASKEVRFIPGKPTNVSSTDGLASYDGQYSLTWTPPATGQVNYYEWSDNGGSSWNNVGTALATAVFTRPNGSITYYVRACRDAVGCGQYETRSITVSIDVLPTITSSATTTTTGNYTIGWGTGQKNGTALNQVWIYEDGVPTWVAGVNSLGGVQAAPNPKTFSKTTQGTYNYYIQACHSSTFTGSTTGGAPQFPQPGTGVCVITNTVSVTYDLPTPAAVGSLTLGDSEGTYDTNGTIALTWAGIAHASKYNLRYGKTGTTKIIRTPGGATDTISGLAEGVWEFEVQACNAFDECGGWSSLVSKEVRFVPGQPTNVTSSDGLTSYDGNYSVTWSPPTIGQVDYYEWSDNAGSTWNSVGTALSTPAFTHLNGTFTYSVRACSNATGCGQHAVRGIAVNLDVLPTITQSATTTTTGNYTIGWGAGQKNGTALNQVWLYENGVATWISGVNSLGGVQTTPSPKAFTKTTPGTYDYYVQACYNSTFTGSTTGGAPQFPQPGTGVCATTNTVSVTYDLPTPAAVGALTLGNSEGTYDTNGTISLTWVGVAHASKYNVRYGMTGTTKLIRTPTSTTDTLSGLAEGVWEFEVQACNSSDKCGSWSPLASKEVRYVPGPPTNVTSSDGTTSYDGNYSLTWSPPTIGQVDYYQWGTGFSWTSVGTALSTPPFTRPNGTVTYYVRACTHFAGCGQPAFQGITVNLDVLPTITQSVSTTTSGDYSIGWDAGKKSGTVLNQVWLYENGVATWVSGVNSLGGVQTTPNPKAFTQTTPGTYNYYVQACHSSTFTGSTTGGAPQFPQAGTGVCATSATVTVKYLKPSQEISAANYDIYIGDLNNDLKSDFYFQGKSFTIEDEAGLPITVEALPSFVVHENTTSQGASPPPFSIAARQLTPVELADMRNAIAGDDYLIWSDGITGESKVLLRGDPATALSVLIVTANDTEIPSIKAVFQPHPSANLSDRNLSVSLHEFNNDDRKDVGINGYAYLSNGDGTLDVDPVLQVVAPASVAASLVFMTGVPRITWPTKIDWSNVATGTYYEVVEKLNGVSTGVTQAVTSNSAMFGELTSLGTYTYSVRLCRSASGSVFCSESTESNTVKSKLNDAPSVGSPMVSTNGVFGVSWSFVTGATRYELYENNVLVQNSASMIKFFDSENPKLNGTSLYQVRACKGTVCGPLSNLTMTVVNVPTNTGTPGTLINPTLSPILNGQVNDLPNTTAINNVPVGTLAGQFRVNESGAATYNVSISTVSGIAGVTPQITLNYSSQGTNGLMGKGWSLGGLSGISRCRQTLSQDGQAMPLSWDDNDRFCLDGQRLMLVPGSVAYGYPGSEYKTEIDSFVTVKAVGGSIGHPDYFIVEAKDGSVTRYGDSGADGSEVKLSKGVLSWGIKEFKDNVGNPIAYVYEGNTTNHHIKEIRYAYGDKGTGASCGAFIQFNYEVRQDAMSMYIAGSEIKNTNRLSNVSVYNGGCSVGSATASRVYHISYDTAYQYAAVADQHSYPSIVKSIQECSDAAANRARCYPATSFQWNGGNRNDYPSQSSVYGNVLGDTTLTSDTNVVTNYSLLDINGNGVLDVVWSEVSITGGLTTIYYNYDIGAVSSGNGPKLFLSVTDSLKAPKFEAIDYNGDSHQDLLLYDQEFNKWELYLAVVDQNGWKLVRQDTLELQAQGYPGNTLPFSDKNIRVGDINSDGLADIVELDVSNQAIKVHRLTKINGASASSPVSYKFNEPTVYALIGGAIDGTTFESDDETFNLGDFNADGKVDIVLKFKAPGVVEHRVYLSEESQFKYLATLAAHVASKSVTRMHAIDINADGLTDIAQYDGFVICMRDDNLACIGTIEGDGKWGYRLNTGDGFGAFNPLYESQGKPITSEEIRFQDLNRDGYLDVSWRKTDTSHVDSVSLIAKLWNAQTGLFGATQTQFYTVSKFSSYQFQDANGDSWPDVIKLEKSSGSWHLVASGVMDYESSTGVVSSDQIKSITDGMGNVTRIGYEPLSRSAHYSPIGDIKITGGMVEQCYPEPTSYPYGGIRPAGCYLVPDFTIDTSSYYSQINAPFADLLTTGEAKSEDLVSAPVLEVHGPITLVTYVESTAPAANPATPRDVNQQAKNRVDYFYRHLRMQAAGKGMLGFASLTTVDAQTEVSTETRYRQDWPYIGSPLQTTVQTKEGKLLSRATNTWDRRVVAGADNKANRYQPYLKQSVTESYAYNSDFSGSQLSADGKNVQGPAALQTVTTHTEITDDDYGNVDLLTVTTEGGGDTLVKMTDNDFSGSEWEKRLGRMKSSVVKTTRNGMSETSKTANFTYYPEASAENGLLHTETVEEDVADNELVTVHSYDQWGHKTQVSVTGQAEPGRSETRTTTNQYTVDGRSLTSSTNDLQQSSSVTDWDQATGQAKEVSDINGIKANVYYDAMGKEYLRVDATGAWTRTDTIFCEYISCPTGARFLTRTQVAGGGLSTTYFDPLGRPIRTSKVSFDGRNINVDTEYDKFGRTLRQSTPFFEDGQPAGWTTNHYDTLGRIQKASLYDSNGIEYSKTTYNFTGNATAVTNDAGNTRIEVRNGLNQLMQVTDELDGTISYTYSTAGALTTATTTAVDADPVTVHMCYDSLGRKIGMLDPDKGGWLADSNTDCEDLTDSSAGWWHYRYNAFGELISQTDAKGQVTTMAYDQLGRMIKRTDEDQTRWFYDKYMDGSATPGMKGKLAEVVVRPGTADIVTYNGATDHNTRYGYDDAARLIQTTVLYANDPTGYITEIKYDNIGRVYEQRDVLNGQLFSDSGVQTQFNQYGYAYRTVDIAPLGGGDGVLSEISEMNARGQVTEEFRNESNFVIVNSYNALTGLLESQKATTTLAHALGTTSIQDQTYAWDTLGNLTSRLNKNANVGSSINKNLAESFCYDGLNRLTGIKFGVAEVVSASECSGINDITYNGLGNITSKKDVGEYAYGENAGPHAVTSVSLNGVTTRYSYDANGNMEFSDAPDVSDDRTFTYTRYDMVKSITKGTSSTNFSYGADRARWKRVDVKSGVTTTTTYLGNVERIQKSNATDVEWKRYAGGAIFTYKTDTNNKVLSSNTNTAYVFNDHLGSVDVITDASGKVTNSMSFDPWGDRRDGDTWGSLSEAQRIEALQVVTNTGTIFSQPITQRGYTGHEMVDEMGIIHMNGRIYDAKLGRFLQADPNIDGVTNTQGYNRYSYVHNNPLNATDPSGFLSLRQFVGVIVAAVLCYAAACAGAEGVTAWGFAAGAISGAAQAAANGGNILQGAITGLVTAAVFQGIGSKFNVAGQSGNFWAAGVRGGARHIFVHAMAGGVLSTLQGGKFGNGFISAGLAKGFDANFDMDSSTPGGFFGETFANAVVGGTISELTGGKFANGAFTATFQHLFNELSAAQAAHKDAVEKRIAELVKSGMAVVREMRITITISGHPVTAVADFAYLLDDELVLGEVKTGAEAKFSPAQKKAYWAAIENKMFSISDDAKTGLGLEKGRGSSLTIRAVEIIAPAGSRALGEAARKTYGKAFTKIVGGAFTLIGSTTVMGAELLLTSADAGYGSDCVGCLYNDRPKE